MTVEYLDPRAAPGAPVERYELTLDTDRIDLTIGMLANGFPDSAAFLDHVATALGKRLPHAAFRAYAKPNASIVADDQLLDAIGAECHAVVTAYGH